jgi:RNA polymerase sigma factor (TIGR02999 family)
MWFMSEVTQLLTAISSGDGQASERLLPLVYDELRRLARAHMANERSDHTLQATALVHEAYLRLVGEANPRWDSHRHFFSAAAEAMRRILIEYARGRNTAKRGGQRKKLDLPDGEAAPASPAIDWDDVLSLDEALAKLAEESPARAELVKLRYFAGLSIEEAAQAMNISTTTAKRYWVIARAWLFKELEGQE